MHEEGHEEHEGCGCEDHGHCMHGPMHKEFKMAMLDKKEKMLKAKLEYVAAMKAIVAKMPESKE